MFPAALKSNIDGAEAQGRGTLRCSEERLERTGVVGGLGAGHSALPTSREIVSEGPADRRRVVGEGHCDQTRVS